MAESGRLLLIVRETSVVGELEWLRNGRMRLRYLPAADAIGPLSVSLPLTQTRHQDKAIRPWIEGLFPDRPPLVRAWRRRFGIIADQPFPLLAAVGEDVAGAAQFVRPERLDTVLARPETIEPLTEADVRDLVVAALADVPITDDLAGTGRFSLAGAQAKVALRHTDDGWALPSGAAASTPHPQARDPVAA
ncbi:MAG: HipA N-terminal domain-containing protein [Tetrasphaera sp.]